MAVRKNIQQKLDKLVNYIQKETKYKGWVVMTYRDIARVVDSTPGASTTKRLVEELKEHPNIIYSLEYDPSKARKPYKYSYVTKEQKREFISNDFYPNLSKEEVDYLKEVLSHQDHQDLYELLSVVNYLKMQADEQMLVSLPTPQELSPVLIILEEDIQYIYEILKIKKVLIDVGGRFQLKLSKEAPELSVIKASSINEYVEQLQRKAAEINSIIESHIVPHMTGMSHLEEQLNESHDMINKLLRSYEKEKEEVAILRAENKKMKDQFDSVLKFKNNIAHSIQENLEVFLWQVQQVALEDSRASIAVKNNNAYRARLSKRYTEIGESFYNQVLEASKSI